MIRSNGWLMCLGVGLFFCATSSAQTTPSEIQFADVAMPANRDGKRAPLPTKFFEGGRGYAKKAWITYDTFRPLAVPTKERVLTRNQLPLSFLQGVLIAADHDDGDQQYLLVGRYNAGRKVELYGWIPRKYLLKQQLCLIHDKTKFYEKAMIITSREYYEQLQAQFDEKDGKKFPGAAARTKIKFQPNAPVRLRPVHNAPSKTSFPWFRFFFVFARTDGHVLLGSTFIFEDNSEADNSAKKVIQGWIPEEYVVDWNSREAFQWDRQSTLLVKAKRRSQPGSISDFPKSAYAAIDRRGQAVAKPPGSIFEEQFDAQGHARELRPSQHRYPRLYWTGNADYPIKHPLTNNQLLKVGWIGGFQGQRALSEEEIAKIQEKLALAERQLRKVQILFVIDDTQSMKPWFTHVAAIIRQFRESYEKRGNVFVSVAYYNDFSKTKRSHRPYSISRFAEIKKYTDNQIKKAIEDHPVSEDANPDPLEAVYFGVGRAMADCGFDEGIRFVIVLGDMGDKGEKGSASDIVNKLDAFSPYPTNFLAVQVVPKNVANTGYDKFMDQMDTIAENHRSNIEKKIKNNARVIDEKTTKKRYTTLTKVVRTNDPKEVQQLISEKMEALQVLLNGLRITIRDHQEGRWNSSVIQPGLMEIYRNLGIPIDKLKNMQGVQLFRQGFVWQYSPQRSPDGTLVPQVRLWALMNRNEIEMLHGLLSRLTKERRGVSLRDVIIKEIEALSGEIYDQKKFGRMSLLDATNRSRLKKKQEALFVRNSLLNMNLDDIDFKFTRDDLAKLAVKRNHLQDLIEGKQSTWNPRKVVRDTGQIEIVYDRIGPKTVDRRYKIPGSEADWYWVDVEKELP